MPFAMPPDCGAATHLDTSAHRTCAGDRPTEGAARNPSCRSHIAAAVAEERTPPSPPPSARQRPTGLLLPSPPLPSTPVNFRELHYTTPSGPPRCCRATRRGRREYTDGCTSLLAPFAHGAARTSAADLQARCLVLLEAAALLLLAATARNKQYSVRSESCCESPAPPRSRYFSTEDCCGMRDSAND